MLRKVDLLPNTSTVTGVKQFGSFQKAKINLRCSNSPIVQALNAAFLFQSGGSGRREGAGGPLGGPGGRGVDDRGVRRRRSAASARCSGRHFLKLGKKKKSN